MGGATVSMTSPLRKSERERENLPCDLLFFCVYRSSVTDSLPGGLCPLIVGPADNVPTCLCATLAPSGVSACYEALLPPSVQQEAGRQEAAESRCSLLGSAWRSCGLDEY